MSPSYADKPLGLIAGSGALPVTLAETHADNVFVVALEGAAEVALQQYPHIISPIGFMKTAADALLAAGCLNIVIIGGIERPNLEKLELDEGGRWFLEQVSSGNHEGDDRLLKVIIAYFEMRGLIVCPAQDYLGDQTGRSGPQTSHDHISHQKDIDRAIEVASVTGAQDIGQSVVVCRRLVLTIEGPEGTDGMLQRLRDLSPEFLGTPEERRGVLVKLPKPQQDRRLDVPAIGGRTVELAAAAHLAGIVFEAGGTLFDNFDSVVALAEEKGVFLLGLDRQN